MAHTVAASQGRKKVGYSRETREVIQCVNRAYFTVPGRGFGSGFHGDFPIAADPAGQRFLSIHTQIFKKIITTYPQATLFI